MVGIIKTSNAGQVVAFISRVARGKHRLTTAYCGDLLQLWHFATISKPFGGKSHGYWQHSPGSKPDLPYEFVRQAIIAQAERDAGKLEAYDFG
ncbi:hypothetical protein [Limnobacter sp.]|uniref:hypothetical protein n=1 Tax=Limnobacter sp. TaxID=2003368 RepID=UPI002FE28EA7